MMRVICLLLVSTFALKVNAQQYTKFNGYGFAADRMRSDSVSIHPSDTVRNKAARSIAVLNGVFYIADGTKWKSSGTSIDTTRLVKYTDTASMLLPYSKLKSVGLTMPSAFNVANSPLTSDGTIAVSGAGTASQYVRGDGQLASFPTSNAGGGASVSYYLNGSVNKGTFGGQTYYEMSRTAIVGGGTDFTRTNVQGDGLIAQFITDTITNLLIPAGNWNLELYFNASSSGGTPSFYVELYKYDGNTFTLISSNSISPELIAFGTIINPYFSALAVPETILSGTDRLAMRVFVNTSGKSISLHTENSHLCQIITTFTTGLTTLNGLSKQVQYFATGTSGTDFNISSSNDTHTFNLPTASATNRGALSTTDWTTFNNKLSLSDTVTISTRAWRQKGLDSLAAIELNVSDTATMLNPYTRGSGTNGQVGYWNATRSLTGSSNLFWDNTNARLGILNNAPNSAFQIGSNIAGTAQTKLISVNDITTTDYSNAAFFNSNIATTRLGFVLSNSSSTNWANNHLAILVTGASHPNNNYFTNISGKGNDGGYGMIMGQGSQTTGLLIGTYGTTPVYLGTNNNARLSIFSNGNVGINTTTDASFKLDVNGTARVQSSITWGSAGSGRLTHTSIDAYVDAALSTGQLIFRTNGSTEVARFTANQNMLIGTTTNAGYKIDINGTARVQTSAYFATSSGSVGIGTTAPEVKLDVKGTSTGALTGMALFRDASTNGNGLLVRAGTGRVDLLATWISSGINTDLTFTPTTSGGVQNEVMRVTSAGNVGIGTTSPNASSLLDISSTTKGFLPPRMTTSERDLIATPAAGLVIYNTSTNTHQGYNGTTWNNFY